MAFRDGASSSRKGCGVNWMALLLAALLALASVALPAAAKPVKSKPPPKPVVLKPPVKPKPPPGRPPYIPIIVDPFRCQSCATLSVSQYYDQPTTNVTISKAKCNSIANRIAAQLRAKLVAGNATVSSVSPDCSSREQVRVCAYYYFFKLDLPSGAGDQLARDWVMELPAWGYCNKRGMWATTSADLSSSGGSSRCLRGHSDMTVSCD